MFRAGSGLASFDDYERLAVFHRLAVVDEDLDHGSWPRRRDLVHRLHRLDNHQRLARFYCRADFHKGTRTRFRRKIGCPDHRRGDYTGVLRRIDRQRCGAERRRRGCRGFDGACAAEAAAGMACDADRYPVALDGNFGQTGFVKQLRQLANGFVIDCGCPRTIRLARHDYSLAPSRLAIPAMASAYPLMPKPQITARAARET